MPVQKIGRLLPLMAMLAAMPAPAQTGLIQPLAPTGEWTVRAAALCSVTNNYAMRDGTGSLALRFLPESALFEISLAMPFKGTQFNNPGRGSVALLPGGEPLAKGYVNFSVAGKDFQLLRLLVSRSFLNDLTPASTLRLVRDDNRPIDLGLSGLAEGMERLGRCENDLMRSWGYDPEALARLTQRAELTKMGDLQYPEFSEFIGATGITRVRFRVDATGRSRECKVVETSGAEDLDIEACAAIKQARFKPARGPDGRPAPDARTTIFRWMSWYE